MKDYLTIFNKLQSIDENILSKDEFSISKVLFFSKHSFNDLKNPFVLFGTSEHIILMKRFELHYIKTHNLFVYVQFIFSFYQEIFGSFSFYLSSFIFSILTIAFFRLFWKII